MSGVLQRGHLIVDDLVLTAGEVTAVETVNDCDSHFEPLALVIGIGASGGRATRL